MIKQLEMLEYKFHELSKEVQDTVVENFMDSELWWSQDDQFEYEDYFENLNLLGHDDLAHRGWTTPYWFEYDGVEVEDDGYGPAFSVQGTVYPIKIFEELGYMTLERMKQALKYAYDTIESGVTTERMATLGTVINDCALAAYDAQLIEFTSDYAEHANSLGEEEPFEWAWYPEDEFYAHLTDNDDASESEQKKVARCYELMAELNNHTYDAIGDLEYDFKKDYEKFIDYLGSTERARYMLEDGYVTLAGYDGVGYTPDGRVFGGEEE